MWKTVGPYLIPRGKTNLRESLCNVEFRNKFLREATENFIGAAFGALQTLFFESGKEGEGERPIKFLTRYS